MIAPNQHPSRFRIGTYTSGQPYSPARGRYAPRQQVEDRIAECCPVIDLPREQPDWRVFLQKIVRELRIRFYQRKTIKNYKRALESFLLWFGGLPHQITREDVREFLELLVDGGASASWVGVHLSAIRTAFDKMCGRQITSGLMSPRRAKRLPVVLSEPEVLRLLEAAPSLRDKLLLGLMYATGLRSSEVARLKWRDFDFDRRTLNVWQGKGRTDRQVMLPECFRPLLWQLSRSFSAEDYVFPGDRPGRHISPRTVSRVMKRAVQLAGIGKLATPHSLRHSFAAHLVQGGTDIRFIQQLLGHVRLETTKIYTRVAVIREKQIQSPLDAITNRRAQPGSAEPSKPVGRMQIELKLRQEEPGTANVRLVIRNQGRNVCLDGIVAREARPGWIALELPPLEHWERPLNWLTQEQRERVESAQFYQLLQEHVARKFLAAKLTQT